MASTDHCLKFGLRLSTSSWFGSYFVNMYAPVRGRELRAEVLVGRAPREHGGVRHGELVEPLGIRLHQVERDRAGLVVDHDALREVARGRRLEALVGADEPAVEAARRRGVHLEDALERPEEVTRLHRGARRVLDALAQLERPGLAAVRRLRQRDGEIGHEREGLRPRGMLERDEPVLRGLVELPVLQRVVDLRIERAAGALGQHGERAAAVLGHQLRAGWPPWPRRPSPLVLATAGPAAPTATASATAIARGFL